MTDRIRSATIGLLAAGLTSGTALAYEPGVHEATRTGVTLGIPTGAIPPDPGIYMNINSFYYDVNVVDINGHKTGIHDGTAAVAPNLMWVPGWNFLGASFGAFVVVPFVFNASDFEPVAPPCPTGNCSIRNIAGIHNPFFSPVNLSWNLGNAWFAALGFGFYAPIGTIANAKNILPPTAGTGGPGLDFWTFAPRFAVSYLGDGWNLSANFFYEFNTANGRDQYTSGNVIYGDFTATKKFGKWELGPVAAFMWQTTHDTDPLGIYTTPPFDPLNQRLSKQIAVGFLVGYDFGPVKANIIFTDDVYARNTGDGAMIMSNISFKLWGPEAPAPTRPLITK